MRSWITTLSVLSVLTACGADDPPAPEPVAPPSDETADVVDEESADEPPAEEDSAHGPVTAEIAAARYEAAIASVRDVAPESRSVTLPDGATLLLAHWESIRLDVSETRCVNEGRIGSCAALDAVRDVQTVRVDVPGGNPASYYCAAAGGEEVIGTSPEGESGFCRFADGSYVVSWSLVYTPAAGRALLDAAP